MPDSDDLQTDELYKAAALAAELHARDSEQQLSGTPGGVLRTRGLRIVIPSAIALLLLGAIVWRHSTAMKPASAPNTPPPLLLAAELPAPETAALDLLPMPATGINQLSDPAELSNMSFLIGLVTSIKFDNQSSHAVYIYHLNDGLREYGHQILAGVQFVQQTTFGAPWLVTDDHGRSMGLCFAPDIPTTVSITRPASIKHGLSDGYLMPLQRSGAASSQSPPSPATADSTDPTMIEFVNMTNKTAYLYGSSQSGGGQSFDSQIDPGNACGKLTYQTNLWLVADGSQNVICRFTARGVPRVAIIWPQRAK